MNQLNSPMEIFKLLEKTNCRKCNEPTCLAFAASVFKGQKQLDECPGLSREIIERFGGKTENQSTVERDMEKAAEELKQRITTLDLSSAARKLGADFSSGRLTFKVLGKDFSVDAGGNLYSDIHINPWVTIPILNYIIEGGGRPVEGNWVPFRELPGGKNWYRLFGQRCEKPLKRVADTYTDLFEDIIHIFNGRQVENHYESDISLVLSPLPRVPMLLCYWKPEEGLESSLNLFFDSTAEDNLNIESIYALATGLVRMFEKIASRHSFEH